MPSYCNENTGFSKLFKVFKCLCSICILANWKVLIRVLHVTFFFTEPINLSVVLCFSYCKCAALEEKSKKINVSWTLLADLQTVLPVAGKEFKVVPAALESNKIHEHGWHLLGRTRSKFAFTQSWWRYKFVLWMVNCCKIGDIFSGETFSLFMASCITHWQSCFALWKAFVSPILFVCFVKVHLPSLAFLVKRLYNNTCTAKDHSTLTTSFHHFDIRMEQFVHSSNTYRKTIVRWSCADCFSYLQHHRKIFLIIFC